MYHIRGISTIPFAKNKPYFSKAPKGAFVFSITPAGPRPLLVEYLPRYSEEQRRRHDVRPGLTGYAQAFGRNSLTWEEKFEKDVYYADHISFLLDTKIIFKTVAVVLKREGISSENCATMDEFMGSEAGEKINV